MNDGHTRSPLRIAAVIAAVVVVNLLALLVVMRRTNMNPESAPGPAARRGPGDIVGGHPASRAEIDDYIARVRGESVEEAINHLDMNEPLLVRVGIYQNDPRVEAAFQRCLADRRLAKIFENLEARDRVEARAVALHAFSTRWEQYKNDVLSCLDQWEVMGRVAEPIELARNYYSLCATVFLVNAFGTHDDLLRTIDGWESFSDGAMEKVRQNAKLEPLTSEMASFCPPEPLFVVNLYLWRLLEECGYKSAEELLAGISRRPLITEPIAFTGWDGQTNDFDFTHQRGGVPIDDQRTLRTFTVCRSWLSGAVFAEEEKRVIISSLRSKVEKCLKR